MRRKFEAIFCAALAAMMLAGCAGGMSSGSSEAGLTAASYGGRKTLRLVDSSGHPIPGVLVNVYPETGPGSSAGTSDERGEVNVPVTENAIYIFTRNGRTLLGQTAQNLFSLGPSAPYFYRSDGPVLILPLPLESTGSPLVSPVIDPLSTVPPTIQMMKIGN